jgi:hypothetical protein
VDALVDCLAAILNFETHLPLFSVVVYYVPCCFRSWFDDFTDQQKTAFIQGLFPQLGGSQLHWIAAQVVL